MPASLEFSFQFQAGQMAERVASDQPMKILLLADFSAATGTHKPLSQRRAQTVDIDNLDQVLQRFAPTLLLDLPQPGSADAGPQLALQFQSLDDFTPDHLYRTLPIFQSLRDTRAQLQQPATFAAAVQKLRGSMPDQDAPAAAVAAPAASGLSDFEALLGGKVQAAPKAGAANNFDALIKNIAAPHIVAAHDASQYLAIIDDVCSSLMRSILRHPAFQALEATWRGVHFLITNLELDESLQLHLLDVSKVELAQDLQAAGEDLSQSGLYHLLVEAPRQAPDETPWACWIGDYRFTANQPDVAQLAALGAMAAQARAPFLAAADASVAGCPGLHQVTEPREWQPLDEPAAERWQALRSSPQAVWLGLALPRLLMRVPYGKNSDPVDAFAFEESPLQHEHFLWGNAALGCALLLAQTYQQDQWDMQVGTLLEIDQLPAYTFKLDGQTQLQPGAEVCLIERAVEALAQSGVMVMQSHKNRNAVRLLRFQSLKLPLQALAGPWRA